VRTFSDHPDFKGIIPDLGGPTANMYGFECAKKLKSGTCPAKRCLTPDICPVLKIDHQPQLELLKQVQRLPGVKKVFVASGIRYDMVLGDLHCGRQYLQEVVAHHVSGQMKVAPEHTEDHVLHLMAKPGPTPAQVQGDVRADHPGCRQRAVPDLLPDRRPSRLQRAGYAASQTLHQPKAQSQSGAGANLHPHPVHLFKRHVLHRAGSVHPPADLR
jgi:hypothetical protein